MKYLRRIALATTLLWSGCSTCGAPVEPPVEPDPDPDPPDTDPDPDGQADAPVDLVDMLAIDVDNTDFARNPALLQRLRTGPHAYFRFIHQEFSTAVCSELGEYLSEAPPVNLHGDAHLEQYAVTDLGRGLTDFDGATTGPALLDLARLGVSLRLAAIHHEQLENEPQLWERLLEGYREGVFADEDDPLPAEPSGVRRIREEFEARPRRLTDTVNDMMTDVTDEEAAALREAFATYVRLQHEQDETLDEHFFDIGHIGRLDLGIGSALDEKFLFRVRGPTDAPEDDVVIEAKEVLSLADIPCIQASADPDPFRILLGQARIAYQPFPYLGFIRAMDTMFWMHGWTNHYRELKVTDHYSDLEEVSEIVYDIGVQLGRGHVRAIATPLDVQLRRTQADYIERHEEQLREAVGRLTDANVAAWERFVAQTDDHPALEPEEEE